MAVVAGNNEDDEGEAILPVLYVSEPAVMQLWLKKREKGREKKVAKRKIAKKSREKMKMKV